MPARRIRWGFRNSHPESFPHQCNQCTKERRFRLTYDLKQHQRDKHGIPFSTDRLVDALQSMSIVSHSRSTISGSGSTYWQSLGAYGGRRDDKDAHVSQFQATSASSAISWTPNNFMTIFQTKIEPNTDFIANCNNAVDQLVRHLHSLPDGYRPSKVIKSGSLGKGTAVKDKSDIDLVVVMTDNGTHIEYQRKMAIEYLRGYLPKHENCSYDGETIASVKIKLRSYTGQTIDVDVLPTFIDLDTVGIESVYSKMDTNKGFRQTASAALAPLQRDFVKDKPSELKQLIRIVKYWRKTCLKESSGKRYPTSYPLELITIGEWEEAGRPTKFDLRQGLYRVMKSLERYWSLQRVWYKYYDKDQVDKAGVCHGYYVIDPANPYNNVMKRCDAWDDVSRQVGQFLRSDLFRNLSPNRDWKA